MENIALLAPKHHCMQQLVVDLADLRAVIRNRRKIQFHYRDAIGDESERIVRACRWLISARCGCLPRGAKPEMIFERFELTA